MLLEANITKVTVYVSVAPCYMSDVEVEEEYLPTFTKRGRHADIESVSRSLGYEHKAYRLHVKTEVTFELLLDWYQYAKKVAQLRYFVAGQFLSRC